MDKVPYQFGLFDCLLAQNAGVSNYSLHVDADAIIRAADAIVPLCKRLGIEPPPPHLAGMSYMHASTIGVEVINGPGLMEPSTRPCIHAPADIDNLREPDDYLSTGIVPQRLALMRELKRRRPDAASRLGHPLEGPVTTAVLMMGQDFFMLPYDDPARAHKLLDFATTSAIHYAKAVRRLDGTNPVGGEVGIPDDFAGMFPPAIFREFVLPYWTRIYSELGAEHRHLHSELLREEHIRMVAGVIDSYDVSVNPYLPPEVLQRSCPVPWGPNLWPAVVRRSTAQELVARYEHLASFKPMYILFRLEHMEDEPKIAAVLKTARRQAGETE